MLASHRLEAGHRVLEPGFGDGSFLLPLIDRFMALRGGDLRAVLTENVWGIELDEALYASTLASIRARWGELPDQHNLVCGDFLLAAYPDGEASSAAPGMLFPPPDGFFDLIVGNPPFGGTVSIDHQDKLERAYGRRHGITVKKETYAYFIVKSLDLLRTGGTLEFICSDTFLTIPTMMGLRNALMVAGSSEVVRLDEFSPETTYPMVVLTLRKGQPTHLVTVDHTSVPRSAVEATANLSWQAGGEFSQFFGGPILGDFMVGTGGMTTGKNEYFVRAIRDDFTVLEPYEFTYRDDPISVERELQRARLHKLSDNQLQAISLRERRGETRRNVVVTPRQEPVSIQLPHDDYRLYNKAQPGIVYSPPMNVIFWKDDGDAVLTYKRNGNWYLHGVGGAPYYGREGLTWRLISSRLDVRYLPEGYILDSGAPCAFLREGVDRDELFFILGWTLTGTATRILKSVINHTLNIQSKDFERLPYPHWVTEPRRQQAVALMKALVARAVGGEVFDRGSREVAALDEIYSYVANNSEPALLLASA